MQCFASNKKHTHTLIFCNTESQGAAPAISRWFSAEPLWHWAWFTSVELGQLSALISGEITAEILQRWFFWGSPIEEATLFLPSWFSIFENTHKDMTLWFCHQLIPRWFVIDQLSLFHTHILSISLVVSHISIFNLSLCRLVYSQVCVCVKLSSGQNQRHLPSAGHRHLRDPQTLHTQTERHILQWKCQNILSPVGGPTR